MDERGQIAIDFLLGISVVLIAIGFTLQFVPGIFISGYGGEEKLGYAAYRTSCILAEDPGWWSDNTSNASGTEWEKHPDKVQRIGLAEDNDVNSRLTETPNTLSKEKFIQFMIIDEEEIIRKLGLFDSVEGKQMNYRYNISFLIDGHPMVIDNYTAVRGDKLPDDSNIAKITRIVLLETGNVAVFDARTLTTDSSFSEHANINFKGPVTENLTMQITNFNVSGLGAAFINATLNGSTLSASSDYTLLKRPLYGDFRPDSGQLLEDDSLRISFNKSLFTSNQEYQLILNFNNVTFTKQGPLFSTYEINLETLYETALLTVEVW
ncbi:hypothetical protein [uncultured Methanomethylovorans sp.]|uniref:DUF7287 family protein n=1 Tax=uncultured Methanomethylovorans sp. TaxID=183759 RepID=UPI002AA8F03B|nr:hypothetical protein [uncultured Methanomethylovorans sp.]